MTVKAIEDMTVEEESQAMLKNWQGLDAEERKWFVSMARIDGDEQTYEEQKEEAVFQAWVATPEYREWSRRTAQQREAERRAAAEAARFNCSICGKTDLVEQDVMRVGFSGQVFCRSCAFS